MLHLFDRWPDDPKIIGVEILFLPGAETQCRLFIWSVGSEKSFK